ncbi:MAG: YraN family protein [Verrucomicrobiales bacterium]
MSIWAKLKFWQERDPLPEHLRRGRLGEAAAKKFLQKRGLKFLTANFVYGKAEIDLVFRDGKCLVFIEVKSRSSEDWTRPADAVDARKKRLISKAALHYLRLLENPQIPIRFDIVEVLLAEGKVREIRHIANAFALAAPFRYS